MTLQQLNDLLNDTGLPVAYNCFKDEQQLPFICYLETDTVNVFADNKTYKIISNIAVELYTKTRDITTEQKVEYVLDGACIGWNKDIEYLDDEQCYFVLYQIQI